MIRSRIQNTAVLDNTGARIQPNLIVGKANGYVSGDILDANAVKLLIKETTQEEKDPHNGKTPSEYIFYKDYDGIKFLFLKQNDQFLPLYEGAGWYGITTDPENYVVEKIIASLGVSSYPSASEVVALTSEGDGYSITMRVSPHTKILIPEKGKYISNMDAEEEVEPTYVSVAKDSNDFTATVRVMNETDFSNLSNPKGVTFVIADEA